MNAAYPKRLIEVDLPIARISAHARREKSIRHGHISTLHIWWARRPLAACRAVICASLWPDPADPLCPQRFREDADRIIRAFAEKVVGKGKIEGKSLLDTASAQSVARWEVWCKSGVRDQTSEGEVCWLELRGALLDFIADFANWDNSTVPTYLETARALTQSAHESLGGEPGTRPLVVDPFAGGGSIPLEALRVGADAFASDLNPVAVLLNKVVLEYIPKYGNAEIRMRNAEGKEVVFNGLAQAVRYWGNWVKEEAEKELPKFYPKAPDGTTPIAYLWARTILSEAPGQEVEPVEVPLIRSLWLCKKPNRKVALRWVRNSTGLVETETVELEYNDGMTRKVRRPLLEVFEPERDSDVESGTVARGSATCPVTGYTTPVASVRIQLESRRGGADDARCFTTVWRRNASNETTFLVPQGCPQQSFFAVGSEVNSRRRVQSKTCDARFLEQPLDVRGIRHTWAMTYGILRWRDTFSSRQAVSLRFFSELIQRIVTWSTGAERDNVSAVVVALACSLDRCADYWSSISTWMPRGTIRDTFARQALPLAWDFAEANPLGDFHCSWSESYEWVAAFLERESASRLMSGTAGQHSATDHPLPIDAADALITDPPYYDAVPYAFLSDFFYPWLSHTLTGIETDLFSGKAVPKDGEIVVDRTHKLSDSTHDVEYYERELTRAFADARRVVKHTGVGIIVFASKTTSSWEAILQAVISANWIVTGSWPIDTEREARISAQGQARLGSSVHLVCRPRENADGTVTDSVGEWRDVLGELPKRIHEWMPRLAAEGVVGADAIFACLGPALEVFSRYSRVEKANGEAATLREYLEHVWAAVSTEALSLIFRDADAAGLEPDARLTAMWLWTLGGAVTNGNGKKKLATEIAESAEGEEETSDGDEDSSPRTSASSAVKGFTLEYDAARKIAQGLGVHLEKSEAIVEVKGDKARLLPVAERTRYLFGHAGENGPPKSAKSKKKVMQKTLFDELGDAEAAEAGWTELKGPPPGTTVLDRLHQAMILFAAGRGELIKRFLVDDGVGRDARFWKLAQSLSALYPTGSDEKRWVDGVLARKKGLGL